MLFDAIRRARTPFEYGNAVSLYNVCGFGYALGMAFRCGGRREMLWAEDLQEIQSSGRSRKGSCRITGLDSARNG